MSKSFMYKRFNLQIVGPRLLVVQPNGEGEYIAAQDALDREAVLQAQIRTLETQLKDSKARYREAGVWDADGRTFKTYGLVLLDGRAMYIKE